MFAAHQGVFTTESCIAVIMLSTQCSLLAQELPAANPNPIGTALQGMSFPHTRPELHPELCQQLQMLDTTQNQLAHLPKTMAGWKMQRVAC